MNDDARDVISRAERIVYLAQWRLLEADALRRLANTQGLARARLEPRSAVIQLVAYDGEHLGHVRPDGQHGPAERWMAVPKGRARPIGGYGSAEEAARSLARILGKTE